MAGAIFGAVPLAFFVASPVFGEIHLLLLGAGAMFDDVAFKLHIQSYVFVAGAIFGAVQSVFSWQAQYLMKLNSSCIFSFHGNCKIWCIQLSLFVAGAIFGKIQTDPERKIVHFSIQHARGEREK